MSSLLARVDAWCRRGDLTLEDIAWVRIIYSAGLLVTLQPLGSLSSRPADRFDPPPGPFRLFNALPPHAALEGLAIATALLAALLLIGLHTRTVSLLLALALMVGFGLTYSFGKIDHTIVVVLVPATMAFSSWGQAVSVDGSGRRTEPPAPAQWPMRFLAVMIGLSFTTAGWVKLRSGWLDPSTHAVQGHLARGYFRKDRTDWLAPDVIDLHLGRLWEVADWFTLALEFGLVLTVVSWRLFRVAVAVAALFHLGIILVLNISFSWNLLGYAAFFRWATILPTPRTGIRLRRWWGWLVALTVGLAMYALHQGLGPGFQHDVRTAMVFVGGACGAAYLVVQLRRLVAERSRRDRAPVPM
jgi:uncharacterized membrane protein YphA (DoxX/SURF4 family)